MLWEQSNQELVRLLVICHPFADFWLPVDGGKGCVWEGDDDSSGALGQGHFVP